MTGLYSAYVSPKQREAEDAAAGIKPVSDWPKLIEEIVSAGHTRARIAMALYVPEEAIERWEKGAIPNYEAGRRLVTLHRFVKDE